MRKTRQQHFSTHTPEAKLPRIGSIVGQRIAAFPAFRVVQFRVKHPAKSGAGAAIRNTSPELLTLTQHPDLVDLLANCADQKQHKISEVMIEGHRTHRQYSRQEDQSPRCQRPQRSRRVPSDLTKRLMRRVCSDRKSVV